MSIFNTGQNTTGHFYLQLNTGNGFTEIVLNSSGTFAQPTAGYSATPFENEALGTNYSTTIVNFATGANLIVSGDYEYGISKYRKCYSVWDPNSQIVRQGLIANVFEIKPGSDEFIINKGPASATGNIDYVRKNYDGRVTGYALDKRSTICYDDRNNFVINARLSGVEGSKFSRNFIQKVSLDVNGNSILGGNLNEICHNAYSAIVGGYNNCIRQITTPGVGTLADRVSNFIGAGQSNTMCTDAGENVIGGGFRNCVVGVATCRNFIGGGTTNNICCSDASAIGGGESNRVCDGNWSTIGGGYANCIENNTDYATIGGGYYNIVLNNAQGAVIAGGVSNQLCQGASVIVGGERNCMFPVTNSIHAHSFIGGGKNNNLHAALSFIGGGALNCAGKYNTPESLASYLFIGGGCANYTVGQGSAVVGGHYNWSVGLRNFVGGGFGNYIYTDQTDNQYNPSELIDLINEDKVPESSFIGGGTLNTIANSSYGSFIGGGVQNFICSGSYSTIIGGFNSEIYGAPDSFILGSRASITGISFTGANGVASGITLRGIGILNDGGTRVFHSHSRSLLMSYENGIFVTPSIVIQSKTFDANNILESVGDETGYIGNRRGVYFGYTGAVPHSDIEANFKSIRIGDINTVPDFVDYSGIATGKKIFLRRYNPSISIGNANHGGYENILIGINNRAYFQSYENITGGLYSGFNGSGALKTIPHPAGSQYQMPWAYPKDGWPFFQGRNVLVGHLNSSTGSYNVIYGIRNAAVDTSSANVLVGIGNALTRDGIKYYTGVSGIITGTEGPTGIHYYKQDNVIVGLGNAEFGGTETLTVGLQNNTTQSYGSTFGIRNFNSGYKSNVLGYGNTSYGSYQLALGSLNVNPDKSGIGINLIGYKNIILDGTGNKFVSIFGDRNFTYGNNNSSLILGGENRAGNAYKNLTVGFNNDTANSDSIVVGTNNLSPESGSSNALIFGQNNIVTATEVGTFGHNNLNIGPQSYSFGNSNITLSRNSLSLGNKSVTNNYGEIAFGAGPIGVEGFGTSQKIQLIWKGITSGVETNIPLMLDSVYTTGDYISGRAFIRSGHLWNGTLNIIAAETGLANVKTENRNITAMNRGGSVVVISDLSSHSSSYGSPTWGFSISGDNANKALSITATGAAGKIIMWNVVGEFNQIFVPTKETVARYEYDPGYGLISQVLSSGNDLF